MKRREDLAGERDDASNALRPPRAPRPRIRTIVMSRVPVPGRTKTRMIPALGADGAARLHVEMTRHTLGAVREWLRGGMADRGQTGLGAEGGAGIGARMGVRRDAGAGEQGTGFEAEVRCTDGTPQAWAATFGWRSGVDGACRSQGEGDLGTRLALASATAFDEGVDGVLLIGCDCPELSHETLRAAAHELDDHDVVIVPARDGGYCLIGLSRSSPALFDGVAWGSDRVLAETLDRARTSGLRVALLPELDDVDVPEDLPRWHAVHARARSKEPSPILSIVIPARNEAEQLPSTIAAARQALVDAHGGDLEIIVVDGGSTDATVEIAGSLGARVLTLPIDESTGRPLAAGRAVQMNLGARAARSDVLLFLHADTRLPSGYLDDIEPLRDDGAVIDPDQTVIAVAFRLAFDRLTPSLRVIEKCANLRSRWAHRPYGDQGLAMRRSTFEALGGFPQVPVMEDVAMVRMLRGRGRIRIARRAVITSSRRWLEHGVWKTTLKHQIALAAAAMGVPLPRIARFLRRGPT